MIERPIKLRVTDPGQALAGGHTGRDGGQALLRVAAVPLQMSRHQGLDGPAVVRVKIAVRFKVVGQSPGLVECPGMKSRDELALVDQPILESHHSEKQVAVSGMHQRSLRDHIEQTPLRDSDQLPPELHVTSGVGFFTSRVPPGSKLPQFRV